MSQKDSTRDSIPSPSVDESNGQASTIRSILSIDCLCAHIRGGEQRDSGISIGCTILRVVNPILPLGDRKEHNENVPHVHELLSPHANSVRLVHAGAFDAYFTF
jgi:hypothetical protein